MMDRLFRPERFDIDSHSLSASKQCIHWHETFCNFISTVDLPNIEEKQLMVNFLSPSVYQHIIDCPDYEDAIKTLEGLYVKPKNEVFTRYLLATAKQEQGQTIDKFTQKLRVLARDCNFVAVSAEKRRDEAIRGAFITGLLSNDIHQRLLEKQTLSLQCAFNEARTVENARQQPPTYDSVLHVPRSSMPNQTDSTISMQRPGVSGSQPKIKDLVAMVSAKCFFCGNY
ncbi:unnamed protein product [Echinostoma caproni]|uniref:Retrotrans_gag domain-containing protein n=1 Tax=Echinostoma caproni TaxID=27848 RepID=A0A183BAD0_9TREM|nr:unnamed protein product [Echinostoma caproni]